MQLGVNSKPFLKVSRFADSLMSSGKSFHILGPATVKARSPDFDLDLGMNSSSLSSDLSLYLHVG